MLAKTDLKKRMRPKKILGFYWDKLDIDTVLPYTPISNYAYNIS